MFTSGGVDCANPPISDAIAISAVFFNEAVDGGDAVIELIPSVGVDPGICLESSVSVTTSYKSFGGSTDCNQNQIPDDCDEMGLDYDNNGSIDLVDYRFHVECLAGPNLAVEAAKPWCINACLQGFDADGDGDVDLKDTGAFVRMFGP